MAKITDLDILNIVGHVYWTAFDDGRMLGKEEPTRLKDFRRTEMINRKAIIGIRKLIKKAKS